MWIPLSLLYLLASLAPATTVTMAVCTFKPPKATTGHLVAILSPTPTISTSMRQISTHRITTIAATAVLSVALPASRIFVEQTTALETRRPSIAGTGNPTLTTGDAPDSICPYGWRLARSSGNKSYDSLIMNYRSRSTPTGITYWSTSNADTPVVLAPVSFARAGIYNRSAPNFNSSGRYWYSKLAPNSVCLNAGVISASYTAATSAGDGFSVRCLAR